MCGKCVGILLVHRVTLLLALPELALWRTGCVAVIRGGAESFLLTAMLDEAKLDWDGKEEKDTVAPLAFLGKTWG